MTFRVRGQLRSPTLMDLAPILQSSSTSAAKVSLCVEPGVGSAVLKLGLIRTCFPFAGLTPSAFREALTPPSRSAVFARTTLLTESVIGNTSISIHALQTQSRQNVFMAL